MKFKFYGDLDCPDWLLADISILTKLESLKLKQLSVALMKEMISTVDELEYEKVMERLNDLETMEEVKSAIAALLFIVSNAARFSIEADVLSSELQQLGLAKESAESICRTYNQYQAKLIEKSKKQSLRLPRIEELRWRVDYVTGSSKLEEVNEPSVQLSFRINPQQTSDLKETHQVFHEKSLVSTFDVPVDKFRVLHNELKLARTLMNDLVVNQQ